MGIAAEPARPVEATIVHGTIETVARQRFRNESCQTFHFAGSWGSHCVAEKKGVSPVSRAGYRCCCWLTVTVLSCTGGGRARPPHLFGFRPPLPGFRETFGLFHSSLGCGRRAYESEGPGAPCIGSGGAKSPLAWGRTAACEPLSTSFRPIPVRRNLLLGIAKLLPYIVPVKRETPYVVSLAMTA